MFKILCRHKHVRCVHGKERLDTWRKYRLPTYANSRCMDCEKFFYRRKQPVMCFLTKKEHDG